MPQIRSRRRLSALSLLSLLLLLAALVAACGSGDTEGNTPVDPSPPSEGEAATAAPEGAGGTLRIGMTSGNVPFPNTPPNEGFEGRRFVGYQIYDGLFNFDLYQGDTVPEPVLALAESYELSEDELTWTFKLREDVIFHDGTPFNAEAVVFQFDRIRNPDFEYYDAALAASNASNLGTIASWEMIDEYTVAITTVRVNAWLPYDLAYIYYPSPTVIREVGNDEYINHASGTGPFRMTNYVDGQVMELEAFEEYWGGRAALDRIELYPMPEPATRLAALQAGDIDWAELPPPDSVELLESQGFTVSLKEYPHAITHQLNMLKPPLDDVRVRQALAHASDREGTALLINNVGYPSSQYMYPGHPWYDESWEGYSYDPDRARELLAEAGYAEGELSLRMIYPTGGSGNMFPGPMSEKLQQDFAAVGINLELIPLEWNNIISAYREGFGNPAWAEYDILYFSTAPLSPPNMARLFVTDFTPPDGCCNPPNYSNPEVDELYFLAESSFDVEEQNEYLRQLATVAFKEVPNFVTVHDYNLRAMSPKVHGFVQSQSWFLDLKPLWVEK